MSTNPRHKHSPRQQKDTSWQGVSKWYDKSVGHKGHHYHQNVVLPGILPLLDLKAHDSLLDLGCGQGVLARAIPQISRYVGLDLAADLIAAAKRQTVIPNYEFKVQDITKQFNLGEKFSRAAIILALQNVQNYKQLILNASNHLEPGGKLLIVINHPYFRIPRQTDWGVDEQTKQQYRKVFRYLTPLEIPITMNPGSPRAQQKLTWSYHHSLADYSQALAEVGLVITNIEEWASDKHSEGAAAKMENRARAEIPLFMAFTAMKHSSPPRYRNVESGK